MRTAHIPHGPEGCYVEENEGKLVVMVPSHGMEVNSKRRSETRSQEGLSWAFNKGVVSYSCFHCALFDKVFEGLGFETSETDYGRHRQFDEKANPTGGKYKHGIQKDDLLIPEWVILVILDCWKHTSEKVKM